MRGVISFKSTFCLKQTHVLDLGLNNHESNVVCAIPSFLIACQSSCKAGCFFFFLPPSWFSFLGAFESPEVGG